MRAAQQDQGGEIVSSLLGRRIIKSYTPAQKNTNFVKNFVLTNAVSVELTSNEAGRVWGLLPQPVCSNGGHGSGR